MHTVCQGGFNFRIKEVGSTCYMHAAVELCVHWSEVQQGEPGPRGVVQMHTACQWRPGGGGGVRDVMGDRGQCSHSHAGLAT